LAANALVNGDKNILRFGSSKAPVAILLKLPFIFDVIPGLTYKSKKLHYHKNLTALGKSKK
jgi:hypothetical protein